MKRITPKAGALVLVLLSGIYCGFSLVSGHVAKAEAPPELNLPPSEAAIDVWKTVASLLSGPSPLIVDIRDQEAFSAYHLPGSHHLPGATGKAIVHLNAGQRPVVIIAAQESQAQKVVGEARSTDRTGKYYYLQGGAKAWYLTFELPLPLFSDHPLPAGYLDHLQAVKRALAAPEQASEQSKDSLEFVARAAIQPALLAGTAGNSTPAGGRKKLSGGCGG